MAGDRPFQAVEAAPRAPQHLQLQAVAPLSLFFRRKNGLSKKTRSLCPHSQHLLQGGTLRTGHEARWPIQGDSLRLSVCGPSGLFRAATHGAVRNPPRSARFPTILQRQRSECQMARRLINSCRACTLGAGEQQLDARPAAGWARQWRRGLRHLAWTRGGPPCDTWRVTQALGVALEVSEPNRTVVAHGAPLLWGTCNWPRPGSRETAAPFVSATTRPVRRMQCQSVDAMVDPL